MNPLERKLNKLPIWLEQDDIYYKLSIFRDKSSNWIVCYKDEDTDNCIIYNEHASFQACIDNTLNIINQLNNK